MPASPVSPTAPNVSAFQEHSGSGVVVQQTMTSRLYRSVVEPTRYEDYDHYELHHPPSEKTQFSYYDASYDPNIGAVGM